MKKKFAFDARFSLFFILATAVTSYAQVLPLGVSPVGPKETPFGYADMKARWPKEMGAIAEIKVCWEQVNANDKTYRTLVESSVKQSWESHAAIRFIGWALCQKDTPGIRITVSDEGPHVAHLGRALDGVARGMVLNFSFQNWKPAIWCSESEENKTVCIKSIAVHEFGHALGLAHEQNRTDQDALNHRVPGECMEKPQGPNGSKVLTPWDARSVMNYCNPIYRENGFVLSKYDISSIQQMYGVRP